MAGVSSWLHNSIFIDVRNAWSINSTALIYLLLGVKVTRAILFYFIFFFVLENRESLSDIFFLLLIHSFCLFRIMSSDSILSDLTVYFLVSFSLLHISSSSFSPSCDIISVLTSSPSTNAGQEPLAKINCNQSLF
jgi:hypothetical protein